MPDALQTHTPLLDLDLLRTVIAIAETGSFSAAAETTFRTPSAISMQVKKMEELLGKSIFNRDSRSVSLTADGEQLLTHARRMMSMNREIVARFIEPEISGVVSLGAPDDVAERFLPRFLKSFAENCPGVTVDVTVENSTVMIKKVNKQQLDLAIVTCKLGEASSLNGHVLFKEPLVWAGVKGGIVVEHCPIPITVWEEGCAWRQAGIRSLEKANRNYRVAFKSAHISGQKAAVLADLAIAPIPKSSCTGDIIPLHKTCDLPELPEYELALLTASDPSPAVSSAAEHIRDCFELL